MLRSAYEAITNSRYAVFGREHTERLGRRMGTEEALRLIPGMIVSTASGCGVRLLPGTTAVGQQSGHGQFLHAAWLRRYVPRPNSGTTDKGERVTALAYQSGGLPLHRELVRIRISQPVGKPYRFHEVTTIWRRNDPAAPPPNDVDIFDGIVCRTGPTISRKHHERVFFCTSSCNDVRPLTADVASDYKRLIRDYRSLHSDEIIDRGKRGLRPAEYLGPDPGDTAWGPYVYDSAWEELEPATTTRGGTLVYVLLGGVSVRALFPAMISRDLHPISPSECLPHSLRPAEEYIELSPSDRLFGWVNQSGPGAWRGKLRISMPDLKGPDAGDPIERFPEPLPLAILGEPRPEQARFYLGDSHGKKQNDRLQREKVRYAGQKKLRGRKAYYHHKRIAQARSYWSEPWNDRTAGEVQGYYQEYRQVEGEDVRNRQNRSITGWTKPGSEIHFKLYLENLTSEEVGALLALASLPAGHFLRLGLGKPLGLGSVHLELDSDGKEPVLVASGTQWRDFHYSDLSADWLRESDFWQSDGITWLDHVECYKQAICAAYPDPQSGTVSWNQLPFIAAFLRAAAGPDDNLPVHYPRTDQTRAASHVYDWFTKNEKTRTIQGQVHTHGLCLPDAAEDDGLPYDHGEIQE